LTRAFPANSEIDVFWACPTQLDPDDAGVDVDKGALMAGFVDAGLGTTTLDFFEYSPTVYHEMSKQFTFTRDEALKHRSIFRTLSQVHNISKTIDIVYGSASRYDITVITRNDYIPYVFTYGIPSQMKQGIYAYRTSPYRTSVEQVGLGGNYLDTEDRAFYGTHDEMMEFRHFYTRLPSVFTSLKLYPEVLHTEFIRSVIEPDRVYYQDGIDIEFPPTRTDVRKHKLNNVELEVINARFSSD
jgi:hypothetical protein